MTDDPVSACQTCDAPVERVFHPVAVHFKGSGFYNTDYGTRKRSREKGEGESADSKPDKASSSDTKSDKKDSKAATTSSSSD